MMSNEQKIARRAWRGHDLNLIPVEIAYDFELRWILENNRADGFRGSRARVAAAEQETERREVAAMRER